MKVLALIASGAAVLPAVLAHGYISDPAAQWVDGYATNGFGSTIDNNMWGAIDNSVYGYGTDGTVAFFEGEFNASGYESLGQFIITNQVLYSSDVDEECGYTVYDSTARSTLPSTNLTYTGFTHPGPCEVWCDDTKVLFNYNCQSAYPDIPAGIPYDESLCTGANRLTVYWLALHAAPWQAYLDCVWLEDGGSSSGAAPSPVTEAVGSDVATAPPTSASGSGIQATTAYPSTSGSTTASTTTTTTATTTTAPTTTTAAPTATTAAPTATTAAPSTSTSTSTTSTASSGSVGAEASTADEASTDSSDETDTTTTTTTTTDAPATTTAAPTTSTTTSTSEKCTASTRRRRRD